MWACARCTLDNPPEADTCQACSGQRTLESPTSSEQRTLESPISSSEQRTLGSLISSEQRTLGSPTSSEQRTLESPTSSEQRTPESPTSSSPAAAALAEGDRVSWAYLGRSYEGVIVAAAGGFAFRHLAADGSVLVEGKDPSNFMKNVVKMHCGERPSVLKASEHLLVNGRPFALLQKGGRRSTPTSSSRPTPTARPSPAPIPFPILSSDSSQPSSSQQQLAATSKIIEAAALEALCSSNKLVTVKRCGKDDNDDDESTTQPLAPTLPTKARLAPSTLARYFHNNACHRFLVFSAYKHSPTISDYLSQSAAVAASSSNDEQPLLAKHSSDYGILVADNASRTFSPAETVALLRSAGGPVMIYQAALTPPASFYRTLNGEQLHFSTCYPDFLQISGARQLRVVDAKASGSVQFAHRVQVAFYALIVRSVIETAGISDLHVSDEGGVWLRDRAAPVYFDLRGVQALLVDFIFRPSAAALSPLQRLLFAPRAAYRVTPACLDCSYLPVCRRDVDQRNGLSRAAYLPAASYALLAAGDEPDVEEAWRSSTAQLAQLTSAGDVDPHAAVFNAYRAAQLSVALPRLEAAVSGQLRRTGAAYVDLPDGEDVCICYTLQCDPISNDVFAFAVLLHCQPAVHRRVAARAQLAADASQPTLFYGRSWAQLVDCLGALLVFFHQLSALPAPPSLQTYVFAQVEAQQLRSYLLARGADPAHSPSPHFSAVLSLVLHTHELLSFARLPLPAVHPLADATTATTTCPPVALDSLLPLRVDDTAPQYATLTDIDATLTDTNDSAAKKKKSAAKPVYCSRPTLVLEDVCQTCFALPVYPAYRLADCVRHLLGDGDGAVADEEQLFALQRGGDEAALRQAMLARARHTWRLVGAVRQPQHELAGSGVEPFRLYPVLDYAHPLLARLAFFEQCEVTAALSRVRASRCPQREARLLAGSSVRLHCTSLRRANLKRAPAFAPCNNNFLLHCRVTTLLGKLPEADFGNDYPYLLVPDDPAGERVLRTFNDVRHFQSSGPNWALSGLPVGFARIEDASALAGLDGVDVFTLRLKVKTLVGRRQPLFQPRSDHAAACIAAGDTDVAVDADSFDNCHFVLHRRYIDDFSFAILQAQLVKMDKAVRRGHSPLLLQLLDPASDLVSRWRPPAADYVAAAPRALARLHALDKPLRFTDSQAAIFDTIQQSPVQLVIGPPGTALAMLDSYSLLGHGATVVVCASTHLAVEGLLSCIEKLQDRVAAGGDASFRRAAVWKLAEWKFGSPPPLVRVRTVSSQAGVSPSKLPERCVVGGTPWSLRKAFAGYPPFADVLIFDEATQTPMLEASLALDTLDWSRGGRLILAGDPHQLGPILHSKAITVDDTSSSSLSWYPSPDLSIFVALQQSLALRGGQHTSQLQENFRMNTTLCRFAADNLYGERYLPVEPGRTVSVSVAAAGEAPAGPLSSLARQIVYDAEQSLVLVRLHSSGVLPLGPSHVEAQLAAVIACTLFAAVSPGESQARFWNERLFVVCPTHIQRLAVRANLQKAGFDMDCVQVDTVEKLQGREADVVVVCYAMFKPEQLLGASDFILDYRRINVAVTRARAKCIVVLIDSLLQPAPQVFESPAMIQAHAMLKRLAAQSVHYRLTINSPH